MTPLYRWGGLLLTTAALVLPTFSAAQTLAPGCRLATPHDQAQMVARGLPKAFQVCPQDEKILGIGQNFDQWYAQLKSQPPCNKNTCTLSCRTRNTGAQVCGTTSKKWGAIGCHPNNNTAIFPTVAHGFAAHIELLRRYCGERGRCTINSVVQQWTATSGDRPAYAAFISRNAGVPANQVFNPNDIDLVGRLALAMACFEAGSLPYSAEELKQGLSMAAGGPQVPVPQNVGDLLQESLTGSYSPSAPQPGITPFFGPEGPGRSVSEQTAAPPLPPPSNSSPPPLNLAPPPPVSQLPLPPTSAGSTIGTAYAGPSSPPLVSDLLAISPLTISSTPLPGFDGSKSTTSTSTVTMGNLIGLMSDLITIGTAVDIVGGGSDTLGDSDSGSASGSTTLRALVYKSNFSQQTFTSPDLANSPPYADYSFTGTRTLNLFSSLQNALAFVINFFSTR